MLRLCPHLRPPGGAQGRHRRRCALPVRLLPVTPLPPRGGGFAARCAPDCRSIGLLLAGLCAAAPAGQSARETPGCLPPPGGTCALHDPGSAASALPVAAALFFLLPRQRNVMRRSLLRQGRASRCSVLRSLDTRSLRIGSAAQGGSTTQMPQQPAASRPGAVPHVFTPRRHGKIWRSGGSTGTRRCTAAAHSPQKNPLEEDR